ncbi:hypothetical protein STCU_10603 [Strigomonas culicis]|uniref:Uncharacterized protein n=1 Tax=Strigomonas culicis TaxID=28005 RepID=S9V3L1_9TRYP|nr:hypothetical protein STCU_10603 [Strigomonas culicis]|eukprot:EPY17450.1 hypothetical protein STCU_10603 [Strigomonas culicis]
MCVRVCPFRSPASASLCVSLRMAGMLWLRACVITVFSSASFLLFLLFSATVVRSDNVFFYCSFCLSSHPGTPNFHLSPRVYHRFFFFFVRSECTKSTVSDQSVLNQQ